MLEHGETAPGVNAHLDLRLEHHKCSTARADAARATRREGYLVLGVPTFALVKNLRVTFSAHVRSRLRNKVVTLAAVSSYPHVGAVSLRA